MRPGQVLQEPQLGGAKTPDHSVGAAYDDQIPIDSETVGACRPQVDPFVQETLVVQFAQEALFSDTEYGAAAIVAATLDIAKAGLFVVGQLSRSAADRDGTGLFDTVGLLVAGRRR